MKVLFIYPDFAADAKVGDKKKGFYSEGLAALSAYLKEHGHQATLYHLTAPVNQEEFQERLNQEDPGLVAFSVRTSNFPFVQNYAGWVKKAGGYLTVAGSYHATIAPEETISTPGIDIVNLGEGELSLLELVKTLDKGGDYTKIENFWVKQGDNIIKNPVRPLVEDLDSLPLPDFELFDYPELESSAIKTASLMLSRGCPYNCTYCCNHQIREVYPNKRSYTRFRSPDRSIEYIKKIIDNYDFIEYISFMDNILPMKKDWFVEFTELYKKEINLPFACNFRVNLVTEDVVKILKDAGCYRLHFGVESGNDYIRNDILNRKISREQVINAFKACRDAEISTLAYNMVGLPFEDRAKALDTIKLNAEIQTDRALAAIFYPYPNTKAYEMSVEAGFIEKIFDYSKDVPLHQDNFTEDEVKFVSTFFRPFMRLYRFIWKLPGSIRKATEKIADKFFLWRRLPYRLLTKEAVIIRRLINWIKVKIKGFSPKLYLFLRDKLLRRSLRKS